MTEPYGNVTWSLNGAYPTDFVEDQVFLLQAKGLPISYTAHPDGSLLITTRKGYSGIVKLLIETMSQSDTSWLHTVRNPVISRWATETVVGYGNQ